MSDITGYEIIGEQIRAKDAEIAQLKDTLGRSIQLHNELDAEIARLKAVQAINEAAIRGLSDACRDRDKLIRELCDALFDMAPDPYDDFFGPLIQRAREATR